MSGYWESHCTPGYQFNTEFGVAIIESHQAQELHRSHEEFNDFWKMNLMGIM